VSVRAITAPLRRLRVSVRRRVGPRRGLPAVLLIGAQKAGTTSLFHYLVRHPAVLAPSEKEIHYFDLNFGAGEDWYRAHFPAERRLADGALTLDASPYYLAHPLAPERAAALLPAAKLIALLRDPVDRALSHYHHEVRGGRESLSLVAALDAEAGRLAGEEERLRVIPGYYSAAHHRHSYLLRGLYLQQLQRWLRWYGRDRVLVLQSERLFRDPAAVTAAVLRFLALPPGPEGRYGVFLQGRYERTAPGELRSRLAAFFQPHNRALYDWMGEEWDWQ